MPTASVEITAVCGLKARHGNVGLRVQLFGDAPGDGIQFHAIQAAILHGFWQHPKEVAHAHGRLQDVARPETHALHGIVDTTDNSGAGVVGVQGAGTGGGVFVLGKQPFQLCVFLCPTVFAGVKGIRQTAPAHILGKHLLLLGGGNTVLLFQLEHRFDGFDISRVLLLCAALAQMVVRDVEISGRLRRRFSIQSFIQGSSIRGGLHLSVHYVRDGQFAQFFVRKWRFVLVRLMRRSEIDRQVVQMDVARLAQQPFQIFLAFRAGNRIDLIRVTKLDVQSSDSFDRKILTVQTDCIAHTVITLFWESGNRFIFCQKTFPFPLQANRRRFVHPSLFSKRCNRIRPAPCLEIAPFRYRLHSSPH